MSVTSAKVDDLIATKPLPPTAAVDLHMHTLASDGTWAPEALFSVLSERGFRVVAVCDHDTMRSVPAAMAEGAARGISVIPGVEVTCRWGGRQWHVLVYGIDPARDDERARPFLTMVRMQDKHLTELALDAKERVEKSGKALPSWENEVAGRPPMPVHTLRAMIADKHVANLTQAANLVASLGGRFNTDQPLELVVELAHLAGGVCVVAHPGRPDLGPAMTEETLEAMLADAPIDGLECHYRTYTDEDTAFYRGLAERHGLLISTGSDSHGPGVPVDPRAWLAIWSQSLLERLGIPVVSPADGEPVWQPGMDPLNAKPQSPEEKPSETPGGQAADGQEHAALFACGEGIAANAALPATLGELLAARAEVLERHTKALDPSDPNAQVELDAYNQLVSAHRDVARELADLAEAMRRCRDLPAARHDLAVMRDPNGQAEAFRQFIAIERELLTQLQTSLEAQEKLLES